MLAHSAVYSPEMYFAQVFILLSVIFILLSVMCEMWWIIATLIAAIYLAFCPPRWLLDLLTHWVSMNYAGELIFRYKPQYHSQDKVITITIDDSPSVDTPAILEVLRDLKVKATFFIIQENAKRYPMHLRDIILQGHLVANHDIKDHISAFHGEKESIAAHNTFLESAMRDYGPHVVESSHDDIDCDYDPLHPRVRFFRPGSGLVTKRLLKICHDLGQICALGDVYGHDCQLPWVAFQVWFLRWRATQGSIVIQHDGERPGRALRTAAILRQLIPKLRADRFRLVRLDYMFSQWTVE